jgi:hypothetical protein
MKKHNINLQSKSIMYRASCRIWQASPQKPKAVLMAQAANI